MVASMTKVIYSHLGVIMATISSQIGDPSEALKSDQKPRCLVGDLTETDMPMETHMPAESNRNLNTNAIYLYLYT